VLRSSTLRCGPWPSRCVDSVALSSAQSCTAAHSRLASLHLGASRAAQLAAASRLSAVPLREERRAWFSSKLHGGPQPPRVTPPRSVASCAARLRRGLWPSRCVHSVAPGSAQSCTMDHSRLASLHLGASRAAQLATASRPLAVPLREERRAWFSSKLHGVTAASHHSTSERRVQRSSPPRRGPWPSRCVKSVAPDSARSCTADHSRLASLHLGASRLRSSSLRRGTWRSRYVQSVATSPAQSCTSVHAAAPPWDDAL